MNNVMIDAISHTWNHCVCCGHLIKPVILGRTPGAARSEFYCFRCYHILAAVQVMDRNQKGGV